MLTDHSSWLRRLYQRIPYFVQCMISYLLIMVIFFAALFLMSGRAQDIARQNYLNERRYALETSAESFTRQLENFRAIPLTLKHTPYYMSLRLLTTDKIDNRHHYAMQSLQVSFAQQCRLLELENNAFIYFMNSGAIMSNRSISFDANDFFTDVFQFEDKNAQEIVSHLSSFQESQILLPVQQVSGKEMVAGEYMVFLYRHQGESVIYGLLMRRAAIEDLFRLSELPQGTVLQILDSSNELFSGGQVLEIGENDYEQLAYAPQGLNARMQLSIPSSYFVEMTAPITSLNRIYIFVSICIGLVLSVLLSFFVQIPVRHLIRISPGISEKDKIKNEFLALDRSIHQSVDENRRLRVLIDNSKLLLRSNLLARLLAQESYTVADETLANDHLPQLSRSSRILCLQLITAERETEISDFISFHAFECVEKLFSDICLMVQIRHDLFALLVSDDEKNIDMITQATATLAENLSNYNIDLAAGLSESFNTLEELHDAYLHAQFTLRYFSPPICIFEPTEDRESFRFVDLSRFQNAVQGRDEDAALAQLDRLLGFSKQSSWVRKALCFILDSICTEMRLSSIDHNQSLHSRTISVIGLLTAQKDEYANTLLETILVYLNENYADSSLSGDSISSHFGISRSYLYRTFRESIGMTPSDKLEQIRMTHANQLLVTTKMNVNSIATVCGYNSSNTFYKAYKKCYHCSPNVARRMSAQGRNISDVSQEQKG